MQLGLFFVYAAALLSLGVRVYTFLGYKDDLNGNKALWLGEVLLLGSIVLVGAFVFLSLVGLYKIYVLWGIVVSSFFCLLHQKTRANLVNLLFKNIRWDVPLAVFCLLTAVFFFRNCYFLVDVDSHSSYLYAQKLWLYHGHSLFADRGIDIKVFAPHFDAVPYVLGIGLFGQETLFPLLVNWFWRFIVLLLVFGYTSYRFNSVYALAAAMFVMFNDHFYFSGANRWVILNAVIIALVFAASYNLWESIVRKSTYRLLLCAIFLSQLMANKYTMIYILVSMTALAILLHQNRLQRIREFLKNKRWVTAFGVSCLFTFFWYLKNWIATGLPTFPALAWKFNTLGWTPEMGEAFMQFYRGLTLGESLKYATFLFVWPGITVSKIVGVTILLLPLITLAVVRRDRFEKNAYYELCFWLGLSLLVLIGTCRASHQDPRHFRYIMGVYTFAAIISVDYIFKFGFSIKKPLIIGIILLVFSGKEFGVIEKSGLEFRRPSAADNLDVLLNKKHFNDFIDRYYDLNPKIDRVFNENLERANQSAWYNEVLSNSAFLMPIRPQIGLWHTTIVNWDSYEDKDKIVQDLKSYGLKEIMRINPEGFEFISLEEYADLALTFDRHPKSISYHWGLPEELTLTKY